MPPPPGWRIRCVRSGIIADMVPVLSDIEYLPPRYVMQFLRDLSHAKFNVLLTGREDTNAEPVSPRLRQNSLVIDSQV